jgi:hypothetical protein
MPEVELPDGTIATFPDNLPQDQIAAAIRAHIGSQNANLPGAGSVPGTVTPAGNGNAVVIPPERPGEHAANVAGSNLLAGALDLAGMPGSLLNAMPKLTANPNAPAGSDENQAIAQLAASGGGLSLPTSADLLSGAKGMGLIDQPSQQPRDTPERLLAAGARGVGGAAPLGLLGGPASLAKATIQGAASGIGGELGKVYFPISENPVVSTLAGVLAGQGAAGAMFGGLGRGVNAVRGAGNPVVEAYDAAGVTPRLAGDVTGRPLLQGLQSMAMRAPFGGRAIHAAQETAGEFANAIENTAASLGGARTLTDAGLKIQGEAHSWLQQWRAAQQAAENAVSAKVPPNTFVDVAPVNAFLTRASRDMPAMPQVGSLMTDPVFKELSAGLANDAAFGIAPWKDMRAWRTKVGDQLEQSVLSRDGKQEGWRQLYGAISDSLGNAATRAGAGSEWVAANAITNQGHNFVETTLSKILNSKNPGQNTISPEAAAQFALEGADNGGTRLRLLRQAMPGAADELAAYKLRDMGMATPGRQTQEMPMSATSFSTDINRLSPEARQALFGAIEPKVGALQTVAERGKDTFAKYGNPSGTAGSAQHFGLLTAPIVIGEAARGGHDIAGLAGAVAAGSAAALPYLAGPVASNLTARETLARYLAAPTGGPGLTGSRVLRAGAAWPQLQPFVPGETGR